MIKIIAEAAVNHLGNLRLAQLTSKAVKDAGGDFIKFQIMNNDELYLPGKYEYGKYNIDDVRRNREESKLSSEDIKTLFRYSSEIGVPATATPFGLKALEELIELEPPFIKIASGDLNYHKLIEKAAESGRKLIVSTGMSTMKEIEQTVDILSKMNFSDYVLMHCISIYPHTEKKSQLGFIKTLKTVFNCEIGFSDHTLGAAASSAAIALGATWIEKHFTLSKQLGGLDTKHSLEPDDFREFCRTIKEIAVSIGEEDRELFDEEILTKKRARRGLYVNRDIKAGEIIKENDIMIVRPETKLPISEINKLVDRKTITDIPKYGELSAEYIE